MSMTIREAIRILDPATTSEALHEISFRAGFAADKARLDAVNEACRVAVAALKAQDEGRRLLDLALRDIGKTCGNCTFDGTIDGDGLLRACGYVCTTPFEASHETACDGWEWSGPQELSEWVTT